MSSAHRSLFPDLLARPEVRSARRDRAFLLIDETLESVLHANIAGTRTFGATAGGPIPAVVARQVRSSARGIAGGGVVRLLLRLPSGRSALPVPATLRRLTSEGGSAVLLATEKPVIDEGEEPARLLADLGLDEAAAALFDRNGLRAAGRGFHADTDALSSAAKTSIDDETSDRRIDFGYGYARLSLVADDLVLVSLEERDTSGAEPTEEGGPPGAVFPAAAEERAFLPERRPMNIAAIVGRWHDRQAPETQAAPLRLIGTPPVVASVPDLRPDLSGPAAVPDRDGREPPTPNDETPPSAGEATQPVERVGAVIVPDLHAEDAPGLDEALSLDDESPAGEDLLPDRDDVPIDADAPGPEGEDSRQAAQDGDGNPAPEAEAPNGFAATFDGPPSRFVWQIDADGRFRSLSPEFASAVGPGAADVVGRSFRAVAEAFGFDADGEIQRLLDRRDTWSGRTVLWPVEGTGRRVPIDLAALPTYGRDRTFDGFRGFGIVRSTDFEEDQDGLGFALARFETKTTDEAETAEAGGAEDEPVKVKPFLKTFEADLPGISFGRRQIAPQPPLSEPEETQKAIGFTERRRVPEGALSEAEEAAFREIGVKLGKSGEAETPDALRFGNEAAFEAPPAAASEERPEAAEEPVLEATSSPAPEAAPQADAVDEQDAAAEDAAAVGSFEEAGEAFASLPLPLLVQSRGKLVHANDALLGIVGYDSLASLNEAGGLGALFAGAVQETASGTMAVRRADGGSIETRVHMQRISFARRSSLLMRFEPSARPVEPAVPDSDTADIRSELDELKAVLDIAADGVVLVDPEGFVRAVNGSAQALFGFSAEEFRGRPLSGLFAHESQKAVLDYLETLRDGGLAGIMNDGREVIGRVAQGGFIPLFITVGRLSEERGWCVVIRDIARWKRIEEELVNARRAAEAASLHKSRFLANISHELRTPLNAIIGFADVMASECFGPIGNERYIEYLGDIKRSGHHVLDLVNDLLDISKIEAGKMELNFESVSLNEVLAEVVSVMQPQANRERVIVRSNLPASVPPVVADRRTIRQIALNLLSNSVRFTPAGGQIIASTTYTAEGDVLLRVRDSGIGMTEREIEIALTPFQQVHQPPTEARSEGTGLGLPLTKAMAEANRAGFAIRSTPGEGTLVEITFPAQRVLAD